MFDPAKSTAATPEIVQRIADKAAQAGVSEPIQVMRTLRAALDDEVNKPIVLTIEQLRPFLDLFRHPSKSRLAAEVRAKLERSWMLITDKYRPVQIVKSQTDATVVYTIPAQIMPSPIVHTQGMDAARHEHQSLMKSQTTPDPVKDNALVAVGNEFLAGVAEDPTFSRLVEDYYQEWQRAEAALGIGNAVASGQPESVITPTVTSDAMPVEVFD